MALRLSRGTARNQLGRAAGYTETLTDTLQLLEHGLLDRAKAHAICDTVAFHTPETALAVQARVLPRAPEQTIAQLRAALWRALIAVDPRGAAERHRAAKKERRVTLSGKDDGMASLWAFLAAPDAIASYEWLTRLARSLGKDDPRPMDARRADLLVDLLTGRLELHDPDDPDNGNEADTEETDTEETSSEGADTESADSESADTESADTESADTESAETCGVDETEIEGTDAVDKTSPESAGPDTTEPDDPDVTDASDEPLADRPGPGRRKRKKLRRGCGRRPARAGKPLVHVIVPYSTLTGADDQPCELAGYGPIPADLARDIAAEAVWKRLIIDPLSGAVLDHGRETYRPPTALAEFVRARDLYCRMPGCRRQATNCELDHAIDWAKGGTTADTNLYTGCLHDHRLKDRPGWSVRQIPDGRVEWTTPTGHRYSSDPHDYRPDNDPDPPLLRLPSARNPVPEHLPHAHVAGKEPDTGTGTNAGSDLPAQQAKRSIAETDSSPGPGISQDGKTGKPSKRRSPFRHLDDATNRFSPSGGTPIPPPEEDPPPF
ncbi:MAG TPA: DUF222 domain-containing protein [Pseudonocardia sp.]|nr:DUF222 domain-containing protein [Pseudonocardia sp.]